MPVSEKLHSWQSTIFVFEPLFYLEKGALASSPPSLCSICQVLILLACQQRRYGTVVKNAEIAYTALKIEHCTLWILYLYICICLRYDYMVS